MGKADVILKQWLRNKVRFADLFNAVVFDGEQVIKPEELEELNSESGKDTLRHAGTWDAVRCTFVHRPDASGVGTVIRG